MCFFNEVTKLLHHSAKGFISWAAFRCLLAISVLAPSGLVTSNLIGLSSRILQILCSVTVLLCCWSSRFPCVLCVRAVHLPLPLWEQGLALLWQLIFVILFANQLFSCVIFCNCVSHRRICAKYRHKTYELANHSLYAISHFSQRLKKKELSNTEMFLVRYCDIQIEDFLEQKENSNIA